MEGASQVQNLITPELLVQLGFSVVFLIFVYMLWKKVEKKEEQAREDVKEKDLRIQQLTDNLSTKFDENTRMSEGVKNALDRNTDLMEKVLDRFDETMRNGTKDT